MNFTRFLALSCLTAISLPLAAAVYNLKVVTDASPDYSDMPSMIRSITRNWNAPEEKCWAMFYWNHVARRQTAPMMLHGMALTDPIRQFNDYGYTMCSTISGINCSIWDAMGLKPRYWDISNHTVPEVEYGGAWHMYDNSLSALYTLCDGKTLAGVRDIGKSGACEASGGKAEPGHIAKYHCLTSTSANGFLTGADTTRGLDEEYRCFNPNGLKYRSYFYDWDRGHRYILNLRDHEAYARYYSSLGDAADFFVPNHGKDPEAVNKRYHIRSNGIRTFQPAFAEPGQVQSMKGMRLQNGVLSPENPEQPGEAIFKIEGANVITALRISGKLARTAPADEAVIAVSTRNGIDWTEVWRAHEEGEISLDHKSIDVVNGAYEALVKVTLKGSGAQLRSIGFETTTMLNSKTQPRLNLGRNVVSVGAGEQTESIVLWPELQKDGYKKFVIQEENMRSAKEHPGYMGALFAQKPKEPAFVVFRLDAPEEITQFTYGGRLYNRAPHSRIEFFHSFDNGKNWQSSYVLTNTAQPWDVIHYSTLDTVPPGCRAVLCKFQLQSSEAGAGACSIYALRMEANHKVPGVPFKPIDVTFRWAERQKDYSTVERAHSQRVTKLPFRYEINVGGDDQPIVKSLEITSDSSKQPSVSGYSDGKDVGGEKFVPRWVTYGKNLAQGRPYTVSAPSKTNWGAGDPEGKKLTDGVVGPEYPGGTAPGFGLCWDKGQGPEILVDLGEAKTCAAFRIQVGAGWPWWDALKGEFKDQVEVFTSTDGQTYASQGNFDFNLRWKDLPVNHMWPDEEAIGGHNFTLALKAPVRARYVKYKVTPARSVIVSEVQVLDSLKYDPFDLRIALPE